MGDTQVEETAKNSNGGGKGSGVYTFLGLVIIVVVIVGSFFLFPWKDLFKEKVDKNLVAANAALQKKNWKEAITLFGKSIKSNPANSAAYVGRSRAYLQLRDLDKAMDEANQAVKHGKKSALAYGQRGIVLKLKGKTDAALKDFNNAAKLKKDYSWAYAQAADIYLRQNKLDAAIKKINEALKTKPDFVEALRLRARILSRTGKCKEAFIDFSKAAKLRPNDPDAIQDKAWFLMTCPDEKVQDSGKAMELARKAFDLSGGKDALVQETLAEAYYRQGDSLSAVKHQKKAIELRKTTCPDSSCVKEMLVRLKKYELAGRREKRDNYEILPLDGAYSK
jgi:tetratricopeptide (TPR) repeat protein